MSIGKVTEAFAFVLAKGEFTETILFAEDEIPELKEYERKAAALVLKHVECCYVELLTACRKAFLEHSKGSSLDASRRSSRRPRSVRARSGSAA